MGPVEIVGGIASSIVASGLLRASSAPFAKIARLHRLPQQIKNLRSQDPVVDAAFNDFQIIFGDQNGGLRAEHQKFFNEIERSGIVTMIASSAVLDIDDPHTKRIFSSLYVLFTKEDEQKAIKIYNTLRKVFYESIRSMLGNSALHFYLKTIEEKISVKLDEIAYCANNFLDSPVSDIDEIHDIVKKLARGMQQKTRNIRVETSKGSKQVEISRVYVSSKLRALNVNLGQTEDFSVHPRKDLPRSRNIITNTKQDSDDQYNKISYVEFKRTIARSVVLGDPGGGKSTLCQNICYELASQCTLLLTDIDRNDVDSHGIKLPIRVILRSFEAAQKSNAQLDLLEYIVNDFKHSVSLTDNEIRIAVNYCLSIGSAVLAFDGLDEILDTAKRRDFVDIVEQFCAKFPLCSVLVTSRRVGYRDAPLSDDFDTFGLERFDDPEVLDFCKKSLKIIYQSKITATEIEKHARLFMRQTHNNAHDLRYNPLMLGLMIWLFSDNQEVPANRPEIYSECARLMFEKWDKNRGIVAEGLGDFDLLELFDDIAYSIYGDAEKEEGVSRAWLLQTIRLYFEKQFEDRAKAHRSAGYIVDFVTGRSWVMTEIGENVYKFTHRTFLEYFVARHISSQYDSVKNLLSHLQKDIEEEYSDVVNHLALQIQTFKIGRKIAESVNHFIFILEKRTSLKKKTAILFFVSKALEYLPAPEGSLRSLMEAIFENIEKVHKKEGDYVIEIIAILCNCCAERRQFMRESLALILARYITSEKTAFSGALVNLISHRHPLSYFRNRSFVSVVLDKSVQDNFKSNAKKTIQRLARSDVYFAALSVEWYDNLSVSFIRKYGPELIIEGRRPMMSAIDSFFLRFASDFAKISPMNCSSSANADSALAEFGAWWPCSTPHKLSIARDSLTRGGIFMVPDQSLMNLLSSGSRKIEVNYGAIFLLLATVEVTELFSDLKRESSSVSERPRGVSKRRPQTVFQTRTTFCRTGAFKYIRGKMIGKSVPHDKFLDEWSHYTVSVLSICVT